VPVNNGTFLRISVQISGAGIGVTYIAILLGLAVTGISIARLINLKKIPTH
jgi:hypothetical protein